MSYKSGVELSKIPDQKFDRKNTKFAASLINGFITSDITYSAKYDDSSLMIFYSSSDEKKAQNILSKADSSGAEMIERLRVDSGTTDEFLALIPEIAEKMGTSVSALKERPLEIQLNLAQAYVNLWFSDDTTICENLERIEQLTYTAENEVKYAQQEKALENNTPQKSNVVRESDNHLDKSAIQERDELQQQRDLVSNEEKRSKRNFTLSALHHEVEKLRAVKNKSEPGLDNNNLTV